MAQVHPHRLPDRLWSLQEESGAGVREHPAPGTGASCQGPGAGEGLGDGLLVMLLQHSLRGRASGAEVEQVSAHRIQLRNGLVAREEVHADPGHDWEPVARAVGIEPAELARRST